MKTKIKKIVYDLAFEKKFEKYKRFLNDKKLDQLRAKLVIFKSDPFDSRIKTHKLKGNLNEYWSFSISFSDRILFRFIDKETVFFIDIGSHDIYK